MIDEALASRYARVALANVVAEFPNKLDHLMNGAADVARPSALHPVFYGSYDWHSSVHMHWTLVTLRASFPQLPEADAIGATLDAHLTDANIAVECAYLKRPGARSFERPYGWAWLLKLSAALHEAGAHDVRAMRWRDCVQPLADAFVARFLDYLPRAEFPSRAGMHGNSAFALLLALDYAEIAGANILHDAIVAKAMQWFANDRDYPIAYESSSEDFLSAGLVEAALMRRVFARKGDAHFSTWWQAFVPRVEQRPNSITHWLTPVQVTDRSDPRIAHLDGLNLSRAWCWSLLLGALTDAASSTLRAEVEHAIDAHLAAALPHVAEGEYVGTHWLASFAVLALAG